MRSQKRLPLEQLLPFCVDCPPQSLQPIHWPELFGNDNPVEIEVGFGKGLFLLAESERLPQVNFFGIEVVRKLQLFVATRLALRNRQNVRLALGDARALLRDRVAPASVQAVHVYFPDPWWKSRHKKRRVFTAEFAASCGKVIRPGGLLNVVTDVEEYFGVMLELLRPLPQFRELPPPAPTEAVHDLDYLTNFERKFRKLGLPIYRATFARSEERS